MPITLDLPEESLRYLNNQAKHEFRTHMTTYAKVILREASLLEAARRGPSGNPSITKAMIKDAVSNDRTSSMNRRPSLGTVMIEIFSRLTTLAVGGGLFNLDKVQQDDTLFAGFVIIGLLAATLNTIEIMNRRTQ
ncbi:MAG TPA: hypothetical protein PKE62_03560 [Anaerolineales bacterium]|nr:hypothetical protein [Anaerolineales bacterium]